MVGSADMPPPEVADGTTGASVLVGGGFPLAGSLHPVTIIASITSTTLAKTIFLFMVASLAPCENLLMTIFYINFISHSA
jgi:hypothetical protein